MRRFRASHGNATGGHASVLPVTCSSENFCQSANHATPFQFDGFDYTLARRSLAMSSYLIVNGAIHIGEVELHCRVLLVRRPISQLRCQHFVEFREEVVKNLFPVLGGWLQIEIVIAR